MVRLLHLLWLRVVAQHERRLPVEAARGSWLSVNARLEGRHELGVQLLLRNASSGRLIAIGPGSRLQCTQQAQ